MSDARSVRGPGIDRFLSNATVGAFEVFQSPTGKASFLDNRDGAVSGDHVRSRTDGQATLTKATGFVALKGGRAYWDHSANAVSYKKNNDRDFYAGRFAEDATTSASTCVIDLNADPPYDIDLDRDAFLSVIVGTPAAGGFGYPVSLGGALIFELTATSEAQKVDALSVEGFDKDANAIIEGAFRVLSDGAGTVVDLSLGVADGTHASDADTIAESLLIHLDANDVNIFAESDDGVVEVAATDTTINYTEGSDLASRVEFWMDMRDPADVQIYINGSIVLTGSTFNMNSASGPLFLLVHLEKSTGTETYKLALDCLRVRFTEQ